jgi:hypothetical protein
MEAKAEYIKVRAQANITEPLVEDDDDDDCMSSPALSKITSDVRSQSVDLLIPPIISSRSGSNRRRSNSMGNLPIKIPERRSRINSRRGSTEITSPKSARDASPKSARDHSGSPKSNTISPKTSRKPSIVIRSNRSSKSPPVSPTRDRSLSPSNSSVSKRRSRRNSFGKKSSKDLSSPSTTMNKEAEIEKFAAEFDRKMSDAASHVEHELTLQREREQQAQLAAALEEHEQKTSRKSSIPDFWNVNGQLETFKETK